MVYFTVYSYHVTKVFQSESTLYRYLNVKELFHRNRHDISSLTDSNCNGTRTHYHLIRKLAIIYSPKLAEWLTCAVRTYLYDAFDCVFLSWLQRH